MRNLLHHDNSQFAIDYLAMRKVIGILGMALPFILLVGFTFTGGCGVKSCVSEYYYTNMRDVFVGVLCATGLFLISYKGKYRIDNISSSLAGVCAFIVAFFPCLPDSQDATCPIPSYDLIHLISAIVFFLSLIYISACLFTRVEKHQIKTREKKQRNGVYIGCAIVMFMSILAIPLMKWLFPGLSPYSPEFWLESIALIAFGVSWFIKGKTFLQDKTEHSSVTSVNIITPVIL